MMTDQKAKNVKAAVHILQHVHVFETLADRVKQVILPMVTEAMTALGSPDEFTPRKRKAYVVLTDMDKIVRKAPKTD